VNTDQARSAPPRALALILAWALVLPPLAATAQKLPKVELAAVERAPITEEVRLTGSLTSPRSARLAPEVEGRVAALEVDAGDPVQAGDTLLILDDQLARLELAQARAAVREADAQLADARRRLAEARDLARTNNVADTQVRDLEAEVRQDAAVLERREAERGHRAALVNRHILNAPFSGVVARRMTDLGEWVGPDAPVLELVAVDPLRLDLQVPQGYFGRVAPGTAVAIRLDAYPDAPREAAVSRVVPVSDPNARTFLVRVRLDNADGRYAPGMSARATLRLDTGRMGLVVHRDALIRYPDGRITVWVADGEGAERTVREERIRTGLRFGESVEVTDGLEPGMPVVVRGNETLQDGQNVQVVSDA
jgi:RND family efflux transporter MFP subunit